MNLEKILDFIQKENKRLAQYYPINDNDKEKRVLARAVKLSEEVGELCEQVLSGMLLQKSRKLKNYSQEKLGEEVADVLITTLLLADVMKVDVRKSLEDKMKKIEKRWTKEKIPACRRGREK